MYRATSHAIRTRLQLANRAIAASSVAAVAAGYDRSVRPCADTVFGRMHARLPHEVTLV